jgi:hypothetical protein
MKSLLSVTVAALFAAASLSAVAQSQDLTNKSGAAVPSKQGPVVKTKEMKDKPKAAPMPKMKAKAKKEKPATQEVKSKTGGNVTDKKKEDVKANK